MKNKYIIVAKEKVVDACDDAKPYIPLQIPTKLIDSFISLSWHGLNLSKNGFIIELVIKSDKTTAKMIKESCKYLNLFFWFNI